MTTPAGKPLDPNKDLEKKIEDLPTSAPLESYIRVFEAWKSSEILKTREAEKRAPSALVGVGVPSL